MWPPWPLSLLQSSNGNESESNKQQGDGDSPTSAVLYEYPSTASLMLSYLRQRFRIWTRQMEEIGAQVWTNLPPAIPPLILLSCIPRKIMVEDPATGQEITKRVFPVFSNPLARSMIAFGLGFAVLSWSQQELKRKRKLTPLPLAIPYESVSRVFLPPFLPEDVPEPELEALDKVVAATNAKGDQSFEGDEGEEESDDSMLSKVSPKIRKHMSDLYATASNPQKNIQYYLKEWKRGMSARKREAAKIRRLRVFDELIALQALKRKAAAKNRGKGSTTPPATGFALVTGASEGIGRAIAVELARWEIPLVLVARNLDKLTSLAYDLEACYGVKCCVLRADLAEIDAAEKIHEVTKKAGITVDILVNNAGIAFEGLAVDMTPSDVERMVILNSVTYAKLCQLYGLDMKRRRRGRILNVSSMAGLCTASPNTAVYGATKAFGKSLSLGLAKEMEPYGVGVTCLLPGAVQGTQFRHRSGTRRALCWSMPFYSKTPEAVAHQGVVSVLDAFSPLPGLKDLFRREKLGESGQDEESDISPPKSSSREEGSSWIPLLEPRYKTQPMPRLLKIPEQEAQKEAITSAADEDRTEVPPSGFQTEKRNSTISPIQDDTTDLEQPSCSHEDTCDGSTENITRAELATHDQTHVLPKQKSVGTVELEGNVAATVENEKGHEQIQPTADPPKAEHNLAEPNTAPPKTESDELSTIEEKSKAIDGFRREAKETPLQWDEEDEDATLSPTLGPASLLEHRRFTFPKHSEVTKASNSTIVVV
ncbi:MAG: hypothetical protein SGILL_001925 [Bacillariaceae sp.]